LIEVYSYSCNLYISLFVTSSSCTHDPAKIFSLIFQVGGLFVYQYVVIAVGDYCFINMSHCHCSINSTLCRPKVEWAARLFHNEWINTRVLINYDYSNSFLPAICVAMKIMPHIKKNKTSKAGITFKSCVTVSNRHTHNTSCSSKLCFYKRHFDSSFVYNSCTEIIYIFIL